MTDRPGVAIGNAIRDLLAETLVGSGGVVVFDILLHNAVELFDVQDEDVVQAFSAQAANEAFAK